MRELFIGQVDLSNQIGRPATCAYWILILGPSLPLFAVRATESVF